MSRTPLRLAAVAAAAVPVLLSTAAPAAADTYFSRTTGVAATTSWVQYADFADPAFGNWHVGQLYAYETSAGRADVFSFIDDYECVDGAVPEPDGHGGTTAGCTYTGSRQLTGEGLTFTVARRQASATLSGTLTATTGDPHAPGGGTTIGRVPADFTWTAVEAPVRTTSTYRYRDGSGTYSDSYRSTSRSAQMSGRLGPMDFAEALSAEGSIDTFSTSSRSRT